MRGLTCILMWDIVVIHQIFHFACGNMQILSQFTSAHIFFTHDFAPCKKDTLSGALMLVLSGQYIRDNVCTCLFARFIKMGIDIRCCRDIGVSKEV